MASTAKIVIMATVAVVVGMLFLQPVITATESHTGTQEITNESVTAQAGEFVELDGYNIQDGSETVWGYNDTSGEFEQAVSGTDYELNTDGGEIKALSGSTLIDDGEEALVSYDYQASGATTSLVAGFIPVMLVLLMFVAVAMQVTDIL